MLHYCTYVGQVTRYGIQTVQYIVGVCGKMLHATERGKSFLNLGAVGVDLLITVADEDGYGLTAGIPWYQKEQL